MSAGTWILVRRGRRSQLPSHFPSPKLSISLLEKVTPALWADITNEVAVLMFTGFANISTRLRGSMGLGKDQIAVV